MPATEGEAVVASTGWDVGAFALLSGQPDDNLVALFDFWNNPLTLLPYSQQNSLYDQ
jgi:hypothetical protein